MGLTSLSYPVEWWGVKRLREGAIMEASEPVELLLTTGDAAIDRILRGIVTLFEVSLPGRVRGYYLLGSYADGTAVAISDIDLIALAAGALDDGERALAARLVEGCALLSPTRLDITICDEASIGGNAVLLRFDGRLLYGVDTRASLALPSLADYTRDTLDAARHFIAHILRGVERLEYPLSYPDPEGEFYGYDTIHIPEWYPAETERGVKELVTTATRIARAQLALQAGRYAGSKGGSAADYNQHIHDAWSDLPQALYTQGKLRWGYAVPAEADERRALRALCKRMLGFENDFLARYRDYLLALLRSADLANRAHARQQLREVAYPDDAELRAALATGDSDNEGAPRRQ